MAGRIKKTVVTRYRCPDCNLEITGDHNAMVRHRAHMRIFKKGMFVTDTSCNELAEITLVNIQNCEIIAEDEDGSVDRYLPENIWPCLDAHCDILDHKLVQDIENFHKQIEFRKKRIDAARKAVKK